MLAYVTEYLKTVGKIAIGVAVIAAAIGVGTAFIPKYQQMCGLDSRCRHLRNQVETKQREIHTIKGYQARLLTDPEFVARIAHENRRMFPNELVFIFDQK